ncbi:hypothetical protein BZG36_03536 [Bifiguratus adelaidae]|uniref:Uncharacterized protein n=1 Tax=Bifiguratus adelaidae TaxID=1938954 RepID=A0A261XZC2_9FUNG|nr:hypothetical protein BZG36_03536 [Bifiguratus adelaidae]
MEQFSPKYFDYITMADFVRWLEERNAVESAPKPSSQDFFILANANNTFLDQNDSCLAHLTDPSGRPPIYTEIVDPENVARRKRNVTEHMLEVLGSRYNKFGEAISLGGGSDTDDTEVVNVFYDRRFPFIDNEDSLVPIAYSSKWHNIADTLANQLYPFIAVHWRMERLDPLSNLVPCAVSLVRAIDEIVQDQARNPYYPQIPNIFLLTDYPHLLDQGDTTESQSFKKSEIFQQHHDAIHYLYTHYPLHLTTFESPSTPPIPHDKLPANWTVIPVSHYPDVPDDASTLGIVDKLVAMNANWFIAGEAQVCGKRSSFTTRIIDEREQIYQQDESDKDIETSTQIMNVVDYFSIVGDEDMMLDDGE